MKLFIVDAFTDQRFSGNQAGVAVLEEQEPFPSCEFMQSLAAELKHSETAYVKRKGDGSFFLRYFTPAGEVGLCGHATISAFTVLREIHMIPPGTYLAETKAGNLSILVTGSIIWMDMAEPKHIYDFAPDEYQELYSAYGLPLSAMPDTLTPAIVSTGLNDILLPVKSRELLNSAGMDSRTVCALSLKYKVVGMHLFCPVLKGYDGKDDAPAAFCRNFAPLYGIEEEAATGTSNGALTYYLRNFRFICDGKVNTFLQGESMGKPSRICTIIEGNHIQIGGCANISLECHLY